MQRLIIEKNEAVADIIERILEVQDGEVILVVPKGSRLTDSPSNFRLIAREGNVLSKDISIESVDEEILALSKAAGLVANHPLFGNRVAASAKTKTINDIKPAKETKLKVNSEPEPEPESEEDEEMEEGGEEEVSEESPLSRGRDDDDEEERYDTLEEHSNGRSKKKILVWAVVVLAVIVAGMWFTAYAFGKATVDITFHKAPWTYSGTVTAAVTQKDVDAAAAIIPAELIEQPRTLPAQSFPATGRTVGGQRAHATLTIVNEFSGETQELVATTRFTTPDGKIFRMDSGTIVPGATVDAAGNVTASSTTRVAVTADQPGADYNVGPITRLNIPGFQGTDKYEGFYGILPEGASGGSSTGGPAPTDGDIQSARSQVSARLSDSSQTSLLTGISPELKVLPEASMLATTTFSLNTAVDDQGNFSMGAMTTFNAFAFREGDVLSMLNGRAGQADPEKVLQDMELTYTEVAPDFSDKEMTFTLDARGMLGPEFDPVGFATAISGKNQNEARQAILALPDIADAKISMWPAWLWGLPGDPGSITINVQ